MVAFDRRMGVRGGMAEYSGTGAPKSGTLGTFAGGKYGAGKGAVYRDKSNGVLWVNENTAASPYWSPVSVRQAPLRGIDTDFREAQATALSDTTAVLYNAASGLRMFGAGQAVNDGGSINNAVAAGGNTLRMTASATNPGIAAIGAVAADMVPATHGGGFIDVTCTQVSAITLRGMGIGFCAPLADNMPPPVTAATTVATAVATDYALLHFNVGYTATSRLYVAYAKAGAPATQDFASLTSQNSGVNVAAAGTYQRFRVEVGSDGTVRVFIDKAQVYTSGTTAILDPTTAVSPVLYIESTSAAIKAMDVKRFTYVTHRA